MKKIVLLAVVSLFAIPLLGICEDGNNVADQLGDIFSGKGNTYAGLEINNIPIPFVQLEPVTLMAWADFMVGEIDEDVKRDVRGGVRVAIDWQKMFK